jgi:phosphatidylserine decarboxylase
VWAGDEIPKYGSRPLHKDYRGKGIRLERFAEMARFNYGSTVIVLWPKGAVELARQFEHAEPVALGQRLGLVKT